jgi:hypothetical protein
MWTYCPEERDKALESIRSLKEKYIIKEIDEPE